MTDKRLFKCVGCTFETTKRRYMLKHLRLSQHKDGVTVNDYVWEEDGQVFMILLFTLLATGIMAIVLGAIK